MVSEEGIISNSARQYDDLAFLYTQRRPKMHVHYVRMDLVVFLRMARYPTLSSKLLVNSCPKTHAPWLCSDWPLKAKGRMNV